MLGTGKESVWVCGYVAEEKVQGFKGSNAPDGAGSIRFKREKLKAEKKS